MQYNNGLNKTCICPLTDGVEDPGEADSCVLGRHSGTWSPLRQHAAISCMWFLHGGLNREHQAANPVERAYHWQCGVRALPRTLVSLLPHLTHKAGSKGGWEMESLLWEEITNFPIFFFRSEDHLMPCNNFQAFKTMIQSRNILPMRYRTQHTWECHKSAAKP